MATKTEHSGNKGMAHSSGFWGPREEAKSISRKLRRTEDKAKSRIDADADCSRRTGKRSRCLTPARERAFWNHIKERGVPVFWRLSHLWREFISKHNLESKAPGPDNWKTCTTWFGSFQKLKEK